MGGPKLWKVLYDIITTEHDCHRMARYSHVFVDLSIYLHRFGYLRYPTADNLHKFITNLQNMLVGIPLSSNAVIFIVADGIPSYFKLPKHISRRLNIKYKGSKDGDHPLNRSMLRLSSALKTWARSHTTTNGTPFDRVIFLDPSIPGEADLKMQILYEQIIKLDIENNTHSKVLLLSSDVDWFLRALWVANKHLPLKCDSTYTMPDTSMESQKLNNKHTEMRLHHTCEITDSTSYAKEYHHVSICAFARHIASRLAPGVSVRRVIGLFLIGMNFFGNDYISKMNNIVNDPDRIKQFITDMIDLGAAQYANEIPILEEVENNEVVGEDTSMREDNRSREIDIIGHGVEFFKQLYFILEKMTYNSTSGHFKSTYDEDDSNILNVYISYLYQTILHMSGQSDHLYNRALLKLSLTFATDEQFIYSTEDLLRLVKKYCKQHSLADKLAPAATNNTHTTLDTDTLVHLTTHINNWYLEVVNPRSIRDSVLNSCFTPYIQNYEVCKRHRYIDILSKDLYSFGPPVSRECKYSKGNVVVQQLLEIDKIPDHIMQTWIICVNRMCYQMTSHPDLTRVPLYRFN
jgi:hypothetical protein